jgi:hypothetical protein
LLILYKFSGVAQGSKASFAARGFFPTLPSFVLGLLIHEMHGVPCWFLKLLRLLAIVLLLGHMLTFERLVLPLAR